MTWTLPPLSTLEPHAPTRPKITSRADDLTAALTAAGIPVERVSVHHAPQLTRYAVRLATGTDPKRVERAMDAVELAIGGRARYTGAHDGAVGIEVALDDLLPVYLRETIQRSPALIRLGLPLGEGVHGFTVTATLADMPHLLVAGTTGSGKSVWLTSALTSLLLRNSPADMRLTLVDPKRVELAAFAGLPHLSGDIISEMTHVGVELRHLVDMMEQRYALFEEAGVRDIGGYNELGSPLPRHVLVIDELADLMMQTKTAEPLLVRLLQKGRAAGIHAILATQRPSAAVLTGLIRSNVPARVVFAVQSHHDSKIALGFTGAERLRGQGDGLYLAPGVGEPVRFQAPMVPAADVDRVVAFWRRQAAQSAASAPEPVVVPPVPAESEQDAEDRRLLDEWRAAGHAVETTTVAPEVVLREAGLTPVVVDALVATMADKLVDAVAERLTQVLLSTSNGNGGETHGS